MLFFFCSVITTDAYKPLPLKVLDVSLVIQNSTFLDEVDSEPELVFPDINELHMTMALANVKTQLSDSEIKVVVYAVVLENGEAGDSIDYTVFVDVVNETLEVLPFRSFIVESNISVFESAYVSYVECILWRS